MFCDINYQEVQLKKKKLSRSINITWIKVIILAMSFGICLPNWLASEGWVSKGWVKEKGGKVRWGTPLKFGHGKEHEKEEQIKDLPIARKREKKNCNK